MKAERAKEIKTFTPVILTLETQGEVDKLYALFVHSRLCDAIDLGGFWAVLSEFYNEENTDRMHAKLCKLMK
jgi:hypothetical protein